MHITQEKLDQLILGTELISPQDYQKAKDEAHRHNRELLDVLIGQGTFPEAFVTDLLAGYFQVPAVDLRQEEIAIEDLELLGEASARSRGALIFGHDEAGLKVAMTDPGDLQTQFYLRAKTGRPLRVFLTGSQNFQHGLKRYKRSIGGEFQTIISENIEKSRRMGTDPEKMAQDLPIINIFETILEYAAANASSDIHLEPLPETVLVRFRVDGLLRDVVELPIAVYSAIVARVKILSRLQIDEHRVPQDGRFKFNSEQGDIAIRVSIMPTFHGEKVVLRLLVSSARPLNLNELGLSGANEQALAEEIVRTHGLLLVTGPTGSGKTTTLYTVLHLINKPEVNIVTIEDPIEYDIPRINQTQVNPKTGLTFAEGLRSFLRQNPNVIMVGEIRDQETAELAVHASMTGHLVLATLHTNDAPSALPRLIDMGVEPFLISSTVNVIVAQRLVRRVCSSCVTSRKTPSEVNKLVAEQLRRSNPLAQPVTLATLYQGKGCKLCGNQGYHGQLGIFEILRVNDEMRELVNRKSSADQLRALALKSGMVTMLQDGLAKVQTGVTTIEEVLRVARE